MVLITRGWLDGCGGGMVIMRIEEEERMVEERIGERRVEQWWGKTGYHEYEGGERWHG
jgi:hypothetical protein